MPLLLALKLLVWGYVPISPLLKEIDMDAFTAALQLHQDNAACFVGQHCSMIDLGLTPSIHQFKDKRNTLKYSPSSYTQVSSTNKAERRERYVPRCCPDI